MPPSIPATVASLLEAEQLPRVINLVTDAVYVSLKRDGVKQATGHEVTRRWAVCMKLIGVMRGDLKWSLPRITDTLSAALHTELHTATGWEPPRGSLWLPGDGV